LWKTQFIVNGFDYSGEGIAFFVGMWQYWSASI